MHCVLHNLKEGKLELTLMQLSDRETQPDYALYVRFEPVGNKCMYTHQFTDKYIRGLSPILASTPGMMRHMIMCKPVVAMQYRAVRLFFVLTIVTPGPRNTTVADVFTAELVLKNPRQFIPANDPCLMAEMRELRQEVAEVKNDISRLNAALIGPTVGVRESAAPIVGKVAPFRPDWLGLFNLVRSRGLTYWGGWLASSDPWAVYTRELLSRGG